MRGHLGWLAVLVPLVAAALGGSASVGAQPPAQAGTSRPWTVPRTPDGQPDLQGIWTNATITPLERPRGWPASRFSPKRKPPRSRADGRRQPRRSRGATASPAAGDVGSYNQFWFDSGTTVLSTRQTSLVVDPPDGRVPVRPEAEARRDDDAARSAEQSEFMSVWDRCISRGVPGVDLPGRLQQRLPDRPDARLRRDPRTR